MDDSRERAEELHAHLEATEELPIDHRANRWIGEAQAVADDIRGDLPETARREGAGQIVELLESVEGVDDEEAERHIEEALALARRLTQA